MAQDARPRFDRFADLLISTSNTLTKEAVEAMGLSRAKERLVFLEETHHEYNAQRNALYKQEDLLPAEYQTVAERNNEASAAYDTASAFLHARVEALAEQQPQQQQAAVYQLQPAREPHITSFDGAPAKWPLFRELFEAEVVQREDIQPITKLVHLTKACTGKAAEALGHWTHTGVSFDAAWKLLKDKFNDTYTIKQALARQINELPTLRNETYDGLSQISNTVQSVMRQIEAMGQPVHANDAFMLHQIILRLPRRTVDGWEQRRSVVQEPTIKELIGFIECRARGCLYFEEAGRDQRPPKGQHSSAITDKGQTNAHYRPSNDNGKPDDRQAYKKFKSSDNQPGGRPLSGGTSAGTVVKMCTDAHHLWECQSFKSAPIKKRTELVDQWGLCRTCLKVHEKGLCKFRGCKACDGALHNSLLCPQGPRAIAQVNMIARQKAQRNAKSFQGTP